MRLTSAMVALALLGGAGCYGDCTLQGDPDWDGDWQPPPPSPPPRVDSITLPSFPPVGPFTQFAVEASAEAGLARMDVEFANTFQFPISGQQSTSYLTGWQLGEGLGELSITVHDRRGGRATRTRSNVLVDLTPPKIEFGATELPATNAFLEFWVADAYVVGRVELLVNSTKFVQELGPGYPSTVGDVWDYVLVQIPVSELPEGSWNASAQAWDAAGNTSGIHTFPLVIDPNPPLVSITAPTSGESFSGAFEVTVSASDPEGGPTWIELFVGQTPVADLTDESPTVVLDAADFPPGPAQLTAVARDRAGNSSAPALVELNFFTQVQ